MKKLMLSLVAAAAMGAGGAAFAQDAECQAGAAWGPKPGCGDPTAAPPNSTVWPQGSPYYDPRHDPRSAQDPRHAYDPRYGYYDPRLGYYDPRVYSPAPRVLPLYPNVAQPSRRDRDGDGVRNRYDRWPDDPRRH
jgi:hypothetical protein